MERYLYRYTELFSATGAGTPSNPGGDFSMYCWIEAESADAALTWGHTVLGDYYRHRFAQSDCADMYIGEPVMAGEIEIDRDTIDNAMNWNLPSCRIGKIPEWDRPWRLCNISEAEG